MSATPPVPARVAEETATLLAAARSAAHQAGAALLDHRETGVRTEWKGAIDPVSAADRDSEAIVRAALGRAVPGIAILGEEGGEAGAKPVDRDAAHWVVDPLDGTVNFLHGGEHFAVSIAHVDGSGRTDIAVVHAPAARTTWYATLGGGAWRGDDDRAPVRLRVSDVDRLDRALVATGFPYVFTGGETDDVTVVVPRVLSLRSLGAAAIELCRVADGRLDAYWERRLGPWDTAAGVLIAREAGADVRDPSGAPVHGPSADVVAGNPALVAALLPLLGR